jgi:hypothetical protein
MLKCPPTCSADTMDATPFWIVSWNCRIVDALVRCERRSWGRRYEDVKKLFTSRRWQRGLEA